MLHASQRRPACRYSCTKATKNTVSAHVGRCTQRISSWYWPTVCAFIIHNSNAEIAAAATPLHENSKCTQLPRCLHKTAAKNATTVKHTPAFIDQATLIQLMGSKGSATAIQPSTPDSELRIPPTDKPPEKLWLRRILDSTHWPSVILFGKTGTKLQKK